MNKVRQVIRAEGTSAIQDRWDRVEQFVEFAFRGCPDCRATHHDSEASGASVELKAAMEAGLLAAAGGRDDGQALEPR